MCEVLSRKGKLINWRPAAHHVLYQSDNYFDPRFNANLRCESIIKRAYNKCINDNLLHYDIINEVRSSDDPISGTCILIGMILIDVSYYSNN